MAKTDGRGNPPWTRDETILALALFFDAGMIALSDTDKRVIDLSASLRDLPGNEERARNPSFRNPAGVSFKLSNLQSVATGKGFANVSSTDRNVWKQFENRRTRVHEIATLIRTYASEIPLDVTDEGDEEEFAEGRILTLAHRRVERNRRLRTKLIRDRRKTNRLRCDACHATNPTSDSRLDDAIFDAHNLVPLSALGSTKTKLSDVALLCANCHKVIHRLISTSGKWATVADVRAAIEE